MVDTSDEWIITRTGIKVDRADDADRFERGAVFEGLYAYISSRARARPAE